MFNGGLWRVDGDSFSGGEWIIDNGEFKTLAERE
jgi:hypothetical protein